jgi:hypothetical protein
MNRFYDRALGMIGSGGKSDPGKQYFGIFLCIFVATLCGIPCNDMKFCEQDAVNVMKSVFSKHAHSYGPHACSFHCHYLIFLSLQDCASGPRSVTQHRHGTCIPTLVPCKAARAGPLPTQRVASVVTRTTTKPWPEIMRQRSPVRRRSANRTAFCSSTQLSLA